MVWISIAVITFKLGKLSSFMKYCSLAMWNEPRVTSLSSVFWNRSAAVTFKTWQHAFVEFVRLAQCLIAMQTSWFDLQPPEFRVAFLERLPPSLAQNNLKLGVCLDFEKSSSISKYNWVDAFFFPLLCPPGWSQFLDSIMWAAYFLCKELHFGNEGLPQRIKITINLKTAPKQSEQGKIYFVR